MGRTASGVKGMELTSNICVGAELVNIDQQVLIVTERIWQENTY